MAKLNPDDLEPVAGNGLLPRRLFLTGSLGGLSLLRAVPRRRAPPSEWLRD